MDDAIAKLKKKKYRITPARKALLETLVQSLCPLTISALAKNTDSNEVSVYRNIELFAKENIVEAIHTNDSLPRYALAHGHHHHIACNNCSFVAHIPCEQQMTKPEHEAFAQISNHEVTYYGLCKNCSSS